MTVEVADTIGKKAKGLMHRRELESDWGMLFVCEFPVFLTFWMKDTLIPLDIAFLNKKGKILQIESLKANDLTPVVPRMAYSYALEVNSGWFKQKKIGIGDIIEGL